MAKGIAEATVKIFEQLQGLEDPEERLRAVNAALTMLGTPAAGSRLSQTTTPQNDESSAEGTSDKAKAWIRKNKLESSDLEEMFHFDNGKVELNLDKAIGSSKRQQTVNTYLLTGVAAYLETGTPAFSDSNARQHCQNLGCYDSPNHSNYVKAFGNKVIGSKDAGRKLTAPGLAAAAQLIHPREEDDE